VTWDWARRHGAEPVIYVRREGPLFASWRFLFTSTYRDVQSREAHGPLSWGGMSIFNRAMANSVGASGWATMLRFFEYMQPEKHAAETEWRIVNNEPYSFRHREKQQQIEEALALANTWQIANVRVQPMDVDHFVCPDISEDELHEQLPAEFKERPVRTFRATPAA